jgi:glycosyltransferase involved in cell wall biosynthesis
MTTTTIPHGKTVWISWEIHRRTRELANAFGADLFVYNCDSSNGPVLRYVLSSFYTIRYIFRSRPDILIVQNPSLVLASLACLLKTFFNFKLVVDRHTNFWLEAENSFRPKALVFALFSKYSLRHADLTIVTNPYLKGIVEEKGGRGFVLTDKLPALERRNNKSLNGRWNIVFISTFSDDEPYLEVFKAARSINPDVYIYVTGNFKKIMNHIPKDMPPNLVLTGFLEEQDFIDMLFSADAIMDFTTAEWTLVCGGYEAISAGKPFITSDKIVLREYFNKGTVFVENNYLEISNGVNTIINNLSQYESEIKVLKDEKNIEWAGEFSKLLEFMNT